METNYSELEVGVTVTETQQKRVNEMKLKDLRVITICFW